jgi:hypothetical protein
MGMLGALFSFAVRRGLRPDNPVRGVARHAYEQRDRRINDLEYAVLGEALRTMSETAWPIAVAATDSFFSPAGVAAKCLALCGWKSTS